MKNVLKIIYALVKALPLVAEIIEMFGKNTNSNERSENDTKHVE